MCFSSGFGNLDDNDCMSHLSAGALGLSAAGIDVSLLSRLLCQLFDQFQTDASVGASHKNVAFQVHRHVG